MRHPGSVMIVSPGDFCVIADPGAHTVRVVTTNKFICWPYRTELYNNLSMDVPNEGNQLHCIYPVVLARLELFCYENSINFYRQCSEIVKREATRLRAIRLALFEEIIMAVTARQK